MMKSATVGRRNSPFSVTYGTGFPVSRTTSSNASATLYKYSSLTGDPYSGVLCIRFSVGSGLPR